MRNYWIPGSPLRPAIPPGRRLGECQYRDETNHLDGSDSQCPIFIYFGAGGVIAVSLKSHYAITEPVLKALDEKCICQLCLRHRSVLWLEYLRFLVLRFKWMCKVQFQVFKYVQISKLQKKNGKLCYIFYKIYKTAVYFVIVSVTSS